MYYVDTPKVRGKIYEKGYTITSLAKALGINRNTLSTYLESPESIPYGKLSKMAELLCDTPCEASAIFFSRNLRDTKVLRRNTTHQATNQ